MPAVKTCESVMGANWKAIRRLRVMVLVLAAALLGHILIGCAGWTINGIPAERFKQATADEWAAFAGGMIATNLVHIAGHVVYLEAIGQDWHFEGTNEIIDGEMGSSEAAWFGRAGFLAQLAGQWALRESRWGESMFAAGYSVGTMLEIGGYRWMRPEGERVSDLTMIGRGGNAQLEWGIYTVASGLMAIGTKKDKEPIDEIANQD